MTEYKIEKLDFPTLSPSAALEAEEHLKKLGGVNALKKDSFGGNVNDRIIHRLRAVVNCVRTGDTYSDEDLITVCEEAINMIEDLAIDRDEIYERYLDAVDEYNKLSASSVKVPEDGIFFDVFPGDTVYTAGEETDEDDTPITYLQPWVVKGLAYMDGKKYAIDSDGSLNEIGTRFCIPTDKKDYLRALDPSLECKEKQDADA